MGALGTGLSQSYQAKQQSDALKGLFGGANPPVPGAGGGGGLKALMGMFGGGGEPSSGLEGVGQFTQQGPVGGPPKGDGGMMKGFYPPDPGPAPAGPAGGGMMDTLKGMFGGGGAPPIQSSLTRNMPGGGPKMGASSLFQLLMPK